MSDRGAALEFVVPAWCTPGDALRTDDMGLTPQRTGGEKHRSRFGDPAVHTFREILADFGSSYVLRYSPADVAASGWHRVRVTIPAHPRCTIKFRSGYYADR